MRQSFTYFALLLLTLTLSACATAPTEKPPPPSYHQGSQFIRIKPPLPVNEHPGKVEVVEMFFYACPHCYRLDPKLEQWLQNKPYVEFHRIPAIVGPTWADQARAFYMAKALGRLDELHPELFKAIHKDGKQIYNSYGVIDFFVDHGVDRQQALKLYYSDAIAQAVNDARVRTVKYRLNGVPAVVINGEYVTAPYFVHNQEEMLEVLDFLVTREWNKIETKP